MRNLGPLMSELGPPPKRWPIIGSQYRTKDGKYRMKILAPCTDWLVGYGVHARWTNGPCNEFHMSLADLERRFDAIDNVVSFPMGNRS